MYMQLVCVAVLLLAGTEAHRRPGWRPWNPRTTTPIAQPPASSSICLHTYLGYKVTSPNFAANFEFKLQELPAAFANFNRLRVAIGFTTEIPTGLLAFVYYNVEANSLRVDVRGPGGVSIEVPFVPDADGWHKLSVVSVNGVMEFTYNGVKLEGPNSAPILLPDGIANVFIGSGNFGNFNLRGVVRNLSFKMNNVESTDYYVEYPEECRAQAQPAGVVVPHKEYATYLRWLRWWRRHHRRG